MNRETTSVPAALLILTAAHLLSACGGGGSQTHDSSGLSAPSLSMSFGLKQFRFSWNAAEGASHYRLIEKVDASAADNLIWQGSELNYAHTVPLYARLEARYAIEACDGGGCVRSNALSVTGTLVDAVGYVKASDPTAWGRFGHIVALSNDGMTLLVGAQGTGLIYVFTQSDGTWTQQQMIDALASADPDRPSLNVTLSGDGNVIAAFADGNVHVFERNAGTWQLRNVMTVAQSQAALFRVPIFLSDDGATLAAGAAGDAYVFVRNGASWELQASLPGKGDNLALSADGSLLVAAAHSGSAVEVYSRQAGGWTLRDSIPLYVGFGPVFAFADHGNTLAIGVSEESSAARGINGNDADRSAYQAGAVFLYTRNATAWTRQAYIKASNADGYDRFGYAIDLSADGNLLVVGAYGEDGSATGLNGEQNNASGPVSSDGGSAGAAYVFMRRSGLWTQLAYLKPTNTGTEEFGRAVAISGDGNVIAVGNDYEASASAGIGGDDQDNSAYAAGAVFLY